MIRQVSIQRGRQGTWETLQLIDSVGQAGQNIVYVKRIVESVPVNAWSELLRRYWLFQDEERESIRSVRSQIQSLQAYGRLIGDCDDAAVIVVALARSAHILYKVVAVRRPDDNEFSHVFVMVNGVPIDPTAPVDANYLNWEVLAWPR